jgi:predicted N-acetyltransferase YhbS
MIEFINFKAPNQEQKINEVLDLLEQTFGKEERELELAQLNGSESEFNEDYVFVAYEDNQLLGNLHLTINAKNNTFGCLGGMVTTPSARGKGIATQLFSNACEFFDNLGGKILLLGTNNPLAAKMYEKFGFKFLDNSVIMARLKEQTFADFCNGVYQNGEYNIGEFDAGCRIPIIPLIAQGSKDILMDANANVINREFALQTSCTGLYPRFSKIKENGNVLVARKDNQVVLAMLTDKICDGVHNLDCFAYKGYEDALPKMLSLAIKPNQKYSAIIYREDKEKQKLFESFCFKKIKECDYEFSNVSIPCYYYELNI